MGPDGKSDTCGNDPDDLNSWSAYDESHWYWGHWIYLIPNRAIFSCIAGTVLFLLGIVVRQWFRNLDISPDEVFWLRRADRGAAEVQISRFA